MGKPAFDPNAPFEPVAAAPSVEKPAFDPKAPYEPVTTPKSPMSMGSAAIVKGEEGATAGLRPVVAGIGAGLGDLVGQLQSNNRGISLGQSGQAFSEARQNAIQEQNQASEEHPYVSNAANIGGSLVTLPLMPAVKGVGGAIRLGAGLGAAQAAGSAQSIKEAEQDIAGGAAIAGATHGLTTLAGMGVGAAADTKAGQWVKNKLISTPSHLTGVPDKEIENYAMRADKVNDIISQSKTEGKFDPQLAANHMRDNVINDVDRTTTNLNNQIKQALQTSPTDKAFSTAHIKGALQEYASKLDPVYKAKDIANIDNIVSLIDQKAPDGMMSIQDLQATKNHMYDMAKGAYKQNSEFFQIGTNAANAAKAAGRSAKEVLDQYGPEAIKNANRQLSQLHEIEEAMGGSLLDKTKPSASLYAAGAGANNNNNAAALRDLGKITGGDYLQDARDLATARSFSDPSLFPVQTTGRSSLGVNFGKGIGGGIGAAAGYAFHGLPGAGGGAYAGEKIGGSIGAMLSSPAALKAAIDAGQVTPEILRSPQVQQILTRGYFENSPVMSKNIKSRSQLSK